jgi:diketogulonate reductase-like aldo/keto reductase
MRELPRNLPPLGQGTWHMGEGHAPVRQEADALRLGLDLGMTLIDTAEMYGNGGAERVVAHAIAGRRDEVFLVSKVLPSNATRAGVQRACAASLQRLGTDHLDLYLLHWGGRVPLAETVEGFERLRDAGQIRAWGVSNLDADALASLPPGCAADQVLYNLEHRGAEWDLLPWMERQAMPAMAYSPVGQGGRLLRHKALAAVAARQKATPAQVAIAFTLLRPGVCSIPKAADAKHVRENAKAADLRLDAEDLAVLDQAFPPPQRKMPLAML